jgi:diguanylate cyclase (GGDEF)-like protein/PAS domain S-box-containing protein
MGSEGYSLRTLTDDARDAFIALDSWWRVTGCNEAALRALGKTNGDIIGVPLTELLPAIQQSAIDDAIADAKSGIDPVTIDQWCLRPLRDTTRNHGITPRDLIEDRRAAIAETQAREVDSRFQDFVELAADWFWETDADLRYKYLSAQYQTATGLSPESRLGYRRGEFRLDGPDDGNWSAHLTDLAAHRPFRDFRFAYLDATGQRRIALMSGRPVFDETGTFAGYRGVGRDITEEFRTRKQLEFLAHHDSLTGLPNRVTLKDRLERTLAAARRSGTGVAVLSVDLDDFKIVNDTLGHSAGDMLLCEGARRMTEVLREMDTVARVGGDEFTIIQAESNGWQAASAAASRLIDRLTQTIEVGGEKVQCGASIGISLYPEDGQNVEELLRHADLALYKAKAKGRNSFCFFVPEMNEEVSKRHLIENQLVQAQHDGSLFLQYQPQVEIKTGRIVGLEALVRWMRPGHGLVNPCDFIPIAERSGLIIDIDRWVLRVACSQARAWSDAGLFSGRIAVNLSAVLLSRAGVVDEIRGMLEETRLPPERLEIEITESVLLIDTETVAATLAALTDMGIALALDDFGTGYSSLTYLRRLPVQKVKIDRSFVSNVDNDPEDAVITRAIISLGHSLGLSVVAEGVEHRDHMTFLSEGGCDHAQGYFLARPLSSQDCERYLEQINETARAIHGSLGVVNLAARCWQY